MDTPTRLIEECKGCRYACWHLGVGQGVRCSHPKHFDREKGGRAPLISEFYNCTFYEKLGSKKT